jgi:hypothetical protein
MPRPTISELRSLQNIALQYRWDFEFTKGPNGLTIPTNLNLRCTTAGVPKAELSKVPLNIRGNEIYFNGLKKTGGELEFKFVETVDYELTQFLSAWSDLCYDVKNNTSQNKADVEAIITIYRLNQLDQPVYKYELIGAFLVDYEPGQPTNENAFIEASMKVSYDTFKEGTV